MPDSYIHTHTHTKHFHKYSSGKRAFISGSCDDALPHYSTFSDWRVAAWMALSASCYLPWLRKLFSILFLLSFVVRYFILLLTKWLSEDLEYKYLCIFMHTFTVKVISRAVCQTLEWTVGLNRLYFNLTHAQSCAFLFNSSFAFNIMSTLIRNSV